MRKFGWFLIVIGVVAMLGEAFALQLPTLRWPFNTARETPFLSVSGVAWDNHFVSDGLFPLFGWVFCLLLVGVGITILWVVPSGRAMLPVAVRRLERFKSSRRGYVSFIILLGLMLFAAMDQLVVGKKALAVKYEGEWYFPALVRQQYQGEDFGMSGDAKSAEANYRELDKLLSEKGGDDKVIMPWVPFDPTGDTVEQPLVSLMSHEGVIMGPDGKPYDGLGSYVYDEQPELEHIRFRYRKGIRQGDTDGRLKDGKRVFTGKYVDGELVKYELSVDGLTLDEFMGMSDGVLRKIYYNPVPPLPSKGHYLGTNSSGNDIFAYLYGGLQVNFKAAIIYIPIIYTIGVTIGLLMGLYGGWFDLVVQRLIEIFSNIPFLFVVIIFMSLVPVKLKGLGIILFVLILFGWMGMTYLMRTAALKEKARDYVAAARVSGAS